MRKSGFAVKKYVTILLALWTLAVLSGCGQPENVTLQPEVAGGAVQWRAEGFAAPGKLEEEQVFWPGQYQPWEYGGQASDAEAEELSYLDHGICGELFWHLSVKRGDDGTGADSLGPAGYVLEIYNTASGECMVKQFSPGEMGLEAGMGCLESMDMVDEGHCVFRWADYEQSEEGLYHQTVDRMIYMDFEGGLRTVDLREAYLERDICQDEFTEQRTLESLNWRCDGKRNICVTDYRLDGSSGFYLFAPGGEVLLEYEAASGQQLAEPLRTSDGELILPVYDEEGKYYEFLWADTAAGELCPLVQMEASTPCIRQMYGMQGNDIYYRSGEGTEEGIVRWNIESGRRVQVLGFRAAGIDDFQTMLALREGQTPVLCLSKYKKDGKIREWLAELVEQRPEDAGSIRVAGLTGYDSRVAECAVQASMENPDCRYEYEDASSQEARDRILIELSQGKGPDILFVTLEDMYILNEKGLLLDIGELISPDVRRQLLPGALELGTVDERLLGMPVGVQVETLAAAGDIWPEDSWQLEDLIDLMDEGKLTGAIRNLPDRMMGRYTAPSFTVLSLVNYSLTDSFLIDWEDRKCHFDDERFIRLLELTATDMSGVPTNAEEWLNGGKDILCGYFLYGSDFIDFFAHLEAEGGRIIGYPTEGECGSYLKADEGGVLVVNVNTERTGAAACFLDSLLGEELQSKINLTGLSVRKLSPEDYIAEDEAGILRFMSDSQYSTEIPVFQDGTTSFHRAKTFLESCVAAPRRYSQITVIVAEELDAMYAEQRSPRTTAEIINSRIQLYLDETG